MKDYKLSKAEQETIITFNASEPTANIFSQDPSWMKKLSKLPDATVDARSVEVNIPKSWIKIKGK
jgi:hypothetical protein